VCNVHSSTMVVLTPLCGNRMYNKTFDSCYMYCFTYQQWLACCLYNLSNMRRVFVRKVMFAVLVEAV
jgi:hypothetical protein